MFRVVNGGNFDINAKLSATFTPPMKDISQLSHMQFNDYVVGLRDRKSTIIVAD